MLALIDEPIDARLLSAAGEQAGNMPENPKGVLQGDTLPNTRQKPGPSSLKAQNGFVAPDHREIRRGRNPGRPISYPSAGFDHAARRLVTEWYNG